MASSFNLLSIKYQHAISNQIVVYVKSDAELDASHQRRGHLREILKGIYNSLDQLMKEIVRITHLKQLDFNFEKIYQKLVLQFGANEVLSLGNKEVPIILGFKGIKDNSHDGCIHIRYKSDNVLNRHQSHFPVDITCGPPINFCPHRQHRISYC